MTQPWDPYASPPPAPYPPYPPPPYGRRPDRGGPRPGLWMIVGCGVAFLMLVGLVVAVVVARSLGHAVARPVARATIAGQPRVAADPDRVHIALVYAIKVRRTELALDATYGERPTYGVLVYRRTGTATATGILDTVRDVLRGQGTDLSALRITGAETGDLACASLTRGGEPAGAVCAWHGAVWSGLVESTDPATSEADAAAFAGAARRAVLRS
jgi:hypothetical protein